MDVTLSQKERTLLEDQKNHENICIQKYANYSAQAKDPQLKQIFDSNGQIEKKHLDSINQLLNGNIPQTGQQQNQGAGQNAQNQGSGNAQSQAQTNAVNAQAGGINSSDADMCTDMLMTEKYVSGAYDTAIFECRDPRVRDVLNHIQKEEQKHGEAIYQYMESKGMYKNQ